MADDALNQPQRDENSSRAASTDSASQCTSDAAAVNTYVHEITDGQVVINLNIHVRGKRVTENLGRRVIFNLNVDLDRTADAQQDEGVENSMALLSEMAQEPVAGTPSAELPMAAAAEPEGAPPVEALGTTDEAVPMVAVEEFILESVAVDEMPSVPAAENFADSNEVSVSDPTATQLGTAAEAWAPLPAEEKPFEFAAESAAAEFEPLGVGENEVPMDEAQAAVSPESSQFSLDEPPPIPVGSNMTVALDETFAEFSQAEPVDEEKPGEPMEEISLVVDDESLSVRPTEPLGEAVASTANSGEGDVLVVPDEGSDSLADEAALNELTEDTIDVIEEAPPAVPVASWELPGENDVSESQDEMSPNDEAEVASEQANSWNDSLSRDEESALTDDRPVNAADDSPTTLLKAGEIDEELVKLSADVSDDWGDDLELAPLDEETGELVGKMAGRASSAPSDEPIDDSPMAFLDEPALEPEDETPINIFSEQPSEPEDEAPLELLEEDLDRSADQPMTASSATSPSKPAALDEDELQDSGPLDFADVNLNDSPSDSSLDLLAEPPAANAWEASSEPVARFPNESEDDESPLVLFDETPRPPVPARPNPQPVAPPRATAVPPMAPRAATPAKPLAAVPPTASPAQVPQVRPAGVPPKAVPSKAGPAVPPVARAVVPPKVPGAVPPTARPIVKPAGQPSVPPLPRAGGTPGVSPAAPGTARPANAPTARAINSPNGRIPPPKKPNG